MAEERYNRKNPAVKRILQEVKEMHSNPSDDFMSMPLEENIFEWQFAIRGPTDTQFEGGIYHGRIQLPADYPFKPPAFMLLTPNGRFETQTKICLSISNYHPEHWQPSWSVRTALVALIAFMPTNPNGALGSLDYPKEEQRVLAIKSRESAPKFGNPERQKLIDEIHEYMLSKSPSVPQDSALDPSAGHSVTSQGEAEKSVGNAGSDATEESLQDTDLDGEIIEERHEVPPITNSPHISSDGNSVQMSPPEASSAQISPLPNMNSIQVSPPAVHSIVQQSPHRPEVPRHADDRLFTWASLGLTLAIVVLLLKKFMKANGYGALLTDES